MPWDNLLAEATLPIRPFLNGEQFDDETVRVMGLAFEAVCIALHIGNSGDDIRQAIATKIVDLAQNGERHPDVLCELVLKEIRTGQSDSTTAEAAAKAV